MCAEVGDVSVSGGRVLYQPGCHVTGPHLWAVEISVNTGRNRKSCARILRSVLSGLFPCAGLIMF